MLRFFERLIDPYGPYDEADTPPSTLFAFLNGYLRPFRRVLVAVVLLTAIVGLIEIGLIFVTGRVVDVLAESGPSTFFADHGLELALLAGFILVVRPLFQVLDAALLNQSLLPNFGTLIRWRSHRHVLRQSVGWFENDFAGRIANRI
ncbi:MAG: ABC transporter transmembrane domain-containing protein, partial [Paracoccaceae bacterium]